MLGAPLPSLSRTVPMNQPGEVYRYRLSYLVANGTLGPLDSHRRAIIPPQLHSPAASISANFLGAVYVAHHGMRARGISGLSL